MDIWKSRIKWFYLTSEIGIEQLVKNSQNRRKKTLE